MSNDFDSLYRRLTDTRKRQAEALADSDKQIAALDRLMGKDRQVDFAGTAHAGTGSSGPAAPGRK